jgi:hypothetical protein
LSTVITEFVIDASGAETGSANFIRAARAAQAEADKLADTNFRAQQAQQGQITSMAGQAGSISRVRQQWERLQASSDPVFKAQLGAQKEIERAALTGQDAQRRGIATYQQAQTKIDKVTQRHDALIKSARESTGALTLGERAMDGCRKATSGVSGQLIALSSGAGPVGVFLSALGPWGVAAAIGIGAAAGSIHGIAIMPLKRGSDGKLGALSNRPVGLAQCIRERHLTDSGRPPSPTSACPRTPLAAAAGFFFCAVEAP